MSTTRPIRLSRLTRARTLTHGALAAGVGLLIAFVVFLVATLGAWITVDTHRALVTAIGTSDVAELVLETRVGNDPQAQDAAAEAVIYGALGTSVQVTREVVGDTDDLVQYIVTPDLERLSPAAATRIASGIDRLEETFRKSAAAVGGLTVTGNLADTIFDAGEGAASSAAISPIPLAIIAVLGWFAVMELSRAWGRARARETALLTARGLSRTQKIMLSVSEVALITVIASVVGAAAALLVTWLRTGADALGVFTEGLALTVGTVIVLGLTAIVSVARAAESEAQVSAKAARFTQVASTGALALVVLAAVLAVWQLFATRDTPIDGAWRVALSSLAPILTLIAAALIAVLIAAPLARVIAGIAAKRTSLSPSLPARNVARRLPAYATAVALVVITIAGAVFAASYVSTWERSSDSAAALSAGADVRVHVGSVSAATMQTAVDLGPAAAAYTADIAVGDVGGQLVAISSDQLADVVIAVPSLVDPPALAASIASETGVLPLPEGADRIQFTVDIEGLEFPVSASTAQIWVTDARGVATLVNMSLSIVTEHSRREDPNGGYYGDLITATLSGTAPLPVNSAGVLSVAMTAVDGGRFDGTIVTVTNPVLSTMTGDQTAPVAWESAQDTLVLGGSVVARTSKPYGVFWSSRATTPVIPVVISAALATDLNAAVGDKIEMQVAGTGRAFSTQVAAIVDVVPGVTSPRGVLMALDVAVAGAVPVGTFGSPPSSPATANEVWIAGVDPATVATAFGDDISVPTDVAAIVTGGLITTWWIAPAGAALLAAIALIAMLASLTATRAGEVLILRAVGVAPRAQARMRIVEAATVVLTSMLLGAAAGWAMSSLIVPLLVGAAVPGSRQPVLVMNLEIIGIVVGIIAIAFVVAAIVIARMVRTHATSTRIAEAAE